MSVELPSKTRMSMGNTGYGMWVGFGVKFRRFTGLSMAIFFYF